MGHPAFSSDVAMTIEWLFGGVVFEGWGVFEGGANASDFVAHDTHGDHAEAGRTFEDAGDLVAGDEAEFGVFGDIRSEAVVAGERSGEAGDFSWADGAGWIDGVLTIDRHCDGALADDEDAGKGVAAVKEGGSLAKGDT